MGWYIHNSNNSIIRKAVESFYPEFAAYITTTKPSHFRVENTWCIDYFEKYKNAKLLDKYSEEISQYITEKNESANTFYKWYYEFENSHSLLAEVSSNAIYKPDKVYWIDGLGAEFLSYVLYLIDAEQSNMKVVRSQISRSDIPSSTYHNRFEGENVEKFGALDELGHDSHLYQYLYTLKDELNVLKEIIHEIIGNSKKQSCTVAIVSDHGLSCLSRKAPSKKYDGKFEHEGRYIKTKEDALSDPDYLVHENETDKEYDDIMLSNPAVSLTVIPEPTGVVLTCEGKTYKMVRVGTQWTTLLQDITEGSHNIDIKPDGAPSHQFPIKVVGLSGDSDINDIFDL